VVRGGGNVKGDVHIGDLIFEPKEDEQEYLQLFQEGSPSYIYLSKEDAKKIVQHLTDVFKLEEE